MQRVVGKWKDDAETDDENGLSRQREKLSDREEEILDAAFP